MRNLLTLPLLYLALAGPSSWAAEDGSADEALVHFQDGMKAMNESNAQPERVIEAAMEFTAALKLYQATGDYDKCQEVQANIFWCKKRMNADDLKSYVARKSDQTVTAAVTTMTEVADKVVPLDEADEYFDRAKKFADENPDKHLEITVRFFEVAERFQGSKIGIEAQKLSMAAQGQWMQDVEAHIQKEVAARKGRETVFTKPAAGAASDRLAAPNAADLKTATATAKKLFPDEPRATRSQKGDLAWKLFEEAKATNDDPALKYAMYMEAIQLAQAANDVDGIISFIDETASTFADGFDPVAVKKDTLARIKIYEAAGAVLKLMDDPLDPKSNADAGKYWCFIAKKWDIGLALLTNGNDEVLARVAEMEIAAPSGAMQQAEVADAWYEVAAKVQRPYKDPMYDRARHWYKLAQKSITGASKKRIEDRIEEIFGIYPDPDVDYGALTEKQWDKLKAPVFDVSAVRLSNDTRITLKPGQKIRVVPHPTDTWKAMRGKVATSFTWLGDLGANGGGGKQPKNKRPAAMSMVCWLDEGKHLPPGIFEGPGKLFIAAEGKAASGSIRVKLMMLEEE